MIILKTAVLIFILLNPFILIVYLQDVVKRYNMKDFSRSIFLAGFISWLIYLVFVFLGDFIFTTVLQSKFASFQVFGGIIFLLIGLQIIFKGKKFVSTFYIDDRSLVGTIVMPLMVGPGTVSASILAGKRLGDITGALSIFLGVLACLLTMIILKMIHDRVAKRNHKLIEYYIDISGRITALIIGTFSIEMIMQGIMNWLKA